MNFYTMLQKRAALRGEPTGTSTGFMADVAATAKKNLEPGEVLDGEGGYTVFGRLVRSRDSLSRAYLPLGLTGGARMVRPVKKGEHLGYADVALDKNHMSYRLRDELERDYRPK